MTAAEFRATGLVLRCRPGAPYSFAAAVDAVRAIAARSAK